MFLFPSCKRRRTRLDPDDFTEMAFLLGLLLALIIIGLARLRPRLITTAGSDGRGTDPSRSTSPSGGAQPAPAPAVRSPEPSGLPAPEQLFRGELAEGLMRYDPELGFIYLHPPAKPDDLTRVKGVGQVLAGRLNEWGIYQFGQIAFWSRKNIQEIGQRLSFSERIERDDWVGQAQKLWQEDQENRA